MGNRLNQWKDGGCNAMKVQQEQRGAMTVIYDYSQKSVWLTLEHVQHRYSGIIRASVRSQMTENLGMVVMLLKGQDDQCASLLEQLKAKKGVRSVNLTVIPPEQ
ncbi:putative transcriptional regulator with CopG/Arc/MetJ DNA-binding domain and metal-binding domain [Methanoregula formicica SMSP]|uniref:Putative transcriptional regulator with CopG/Arc/MetJ DNA-binding domain and metal-binding domain n=2 Tax=Methanoregula formicica TaxID=882104 RepID=L0HF72_METFS|nr:putative transcriptional regulator with CopG/Arc/MetJ DNA-binding domain and metal-binding domain [Methanoregula formicica SMSP]